MRDIRAMVAYKDIVVRDGFNVRTTMKGIKELAESITINGLLQPLVVREGGPDKDGKRKFVLIAGERRYRALGLLGKAEVDVKITKMNAEAEHRANIAENDHRMDLEPLDRARRYKFILDNTKGMTQAKLAKDSGVSEAYVSQTLALLKSVAPEVQKAVADKTITPTIAREIATLTKDQQREVLKEVEDTKAKKGKAPTLSDLKDSIDEKKTKNGKPKRGKPAVVYDADKIKGAKAAYEGVSFDGPKPKQAFLEMLGLLVGRLDNPQLSEDKKPIVKGQVAVIEWALGQRDRL